MFRLTRGEQLTIGALVLVVAAVLVGVMVGRSPRKPDLAIDLETMNAEPSGNVQTDELPEPDGATIVVHVAGAVEAPDTYELPAGARVAEAVEKARPTSDADVHALNLAARLVDGQKIVVPRPGEVLVPSDPGPGAGGVVELNSASQAQLETLPGIGPARAKAIIDYRGAHRFRRVEDVMQVPGIGPGTFERIKDQITVR
jgi:competence protein ComEA